MKIKDREEFEDAQDMARIAVNRQSNSIPAESILECSNAGFNLYVWVKQITGAALELVASLVIVAFIIIAVAVSKSGYKE